MVDINGYEIIPGDLFYINKSSSRYVLMEFDEENNIFYYRSITNFLIWAGDYNYYRHSIIKDLNFRQKK